MFKLDSTLLQYELVGKPTSKDVGYYFTSRMDVYYKADLIH